MQEDRNQLIKGDVVEGEKSICDQIDDSLIMQDFTEAGWGKRRPFFDWIVTVFLICSWSSCSWWLEKRLSFAILAFSMTYYLPDLSNCFFEVIFDLLARL